MTTNNKKQDEVRLITNENMHVTVRVRPLNQREIDSSEEIAWIADEEKNILRQCKSSKRTDNNKKTDHYDDFFHSAKKKVKKTIPFLEFPVNKVYDGLTTNKGIFSTIKPMILSAIKGINVTIFAYGQTSSGKTHTMKGNNKEPGIIPLGIYSLFKTISKTTNRDFRIAVSYLEIYNEIIHDLLANKKHDEEKKKKRRKKK